MTNDEMASLILLFKETFPYYYKNPNITIDDTVIETGLSKAETHISKYCIKLRSRILVYLAMHIILKDFIDEEEFIDSQFEELSKIDRFEVGDITVENANTGANKKQPPMWWGSTKYGIRAWELSRICAGSRIGLIK